MSYPILWAIWLRVHPAINVLNASTIARCIGATMTETDVGVPGHVMAEKIAHHGGAFVGRGEFATLELNDRIGIF
jgi:hypothetical protein